MSEELRLVEGPDTSVLSEEEIAIVNMAVAIFLEEMQNVSVAGTFALYAQEKGAEAKFCALSALSGGDCPEDTFLLESVDIITHWPTEKFFGYQPNPLRFGELPSGTYCKDRDAAAVTVVNTTLGRFIAILRMDMAHDYDKMKILAVVLAKVLSMLRPRDVILRKSLGELLGVAKSEVISVMEALNKLFAGRDPNITVWKLRCNNQPPEMFFV